MKLRTEQSRHDSLPGAADVAAVRELKYSERRFDPETDLPSGAVDYFLERYQKMREGQDRPYLAPKIATNLLIMFPELRSRLNLDEVFWQSIKRDLEHDGRIQKFDFVLKVFQGMVLFPERMSELNLEDGLFQALVDEQMEPRRDDNWYGFSQAAVGIYLLYPGRRAEMKVGEAEYQAILEEMQEKFRIFQFGSHLVIARNLAILFPDKAQEIREAIPDMETIIEKVNKNWDHQDGESVVAAANLTIISADMVEVSADGLKLVKQSDLRQIPELPARKTA